MSVCPQIRSIEIVELAFHHVVELFAEQRQILVAARMFFVEPSHQDDVGDGRDVEAPVALLRLRAEPIVVFEDAPGTAAPWPAAPSLNFAPGVVIMSMSILAVADDGAGA